MPPSHLAEPPDSLTTTSPVGREPLQPITRRALTKDVLDSLRRAIIAGNLAPGIALPETRTASELGVSRVPVRESLQALEREGLVVYDTRGTARVRDFSTEEFKEILTLRLLLEPTAARFACQRLQAADVAALEENMQKMSETKCLFDLTLLDVEFHDLVMQTARHRLIGVCWSNIHAQLQVWMARLHQHQGAVAETRHASLHGHQALVEIFKSGQEEESADMMRSHLVSWRERLPKSMWEGDVTRRPASEQTQ